MQGVVVLGVETSGYPTDVLCMPVTNAGGA